MSSSLSPEQLDRLCELIQALCDERITPEQRVQLEAWVCRDKEVRRIYVQYMNLCASIHWDKAQEPSLAQALPHGETQAPRTPLLGFLGDAFQAGTNFLSRSLVLTLLLAVGLPGILFLILALHLTRQPAPVAPIAKVTQTHECIWGEDSTPLPTGADLFSGGQLRLTEGLVEVTFGKGAKVILQGPVTFDTSNRNGGFLRAGSLVAKVPKGARGFTIETPGASVIDLGTEFGLLVEGEEEATQVQVFQGEVELEARRKDTAESVVRRRLAAGRAVRIEPAGLKGEPIIREIAPPVDLFVRHMPVSAPLTEPIAAKPIATQPTPAIIADFSGGKGTSQAGQFPGVAGSGWASAWDVGEEGAAQTAVSVENSKPLFGGGDYLRLLVTRASGTDCIGQSIARRLELAGPVDLKKPYVISFDLRIDALGQFNDPLDAVSICSNVGRKLPTFDNAGWHIQVLGSVGGSTTRYWRFHDRYNGHRKLRAVSSRVVVRQRSTYSFRILVDPQAKQWKPSIAVDGGRPKTFRAMGMRSPGTAKDNGYWPFLHLHWRMAGGNKGADRETIGVSIDSIRITQTDSGHSGRGLP